MTTTAPARAVPAAPPEPVRSRREVLTALSGLLLAMFVAILSSTIVSNALPTIVADLHGDQTGYTWIVTATLLTTTASTPIWGKLADLFSKKLLVQVAIVVFVLASIGAGFAGSMGELIAWRAAQGIGAGGLQALAQVVIAALIPPRERGRYSGYLGAVLAAATVSGPLVGGLLVSTPALGWRWTFFIGVPIGLAALVVLQRTLHVPTIKREVRLDYLGAALISGGVSVLLIWMSLAGSQFAWSSPTSLGLAALGAGALVAAVFVEFRAPEPVVPMSLFRERTVVLSVVASLVVGVVMFGSTVYLGQYFQIARSYDPTTAGLLTLPLVGGLLVASTGSGQLISRFGRWKRYLVLGAVLMTTGLGLLSTIDHTTPVVRIGVFLAVLGLGIGMSMQNLVLAVQNTVDVHDVGAASSLVAFLRSLGGTVGVTVLGVVLDARVTALSGSSSGLGGLGTDSAAEAEAVRAAYGDGLALVFGIAAVASLVTLVAVLLIREVPLRTTVAKAPAAEPAPAAAPTAAPAVETAGAPAPAGRHAADPADAARDRLLAVLVPEPQEALRALHDVERASRDLAVTRERLDASLAKLREIGLDERQLARVRR
ncbi:MFS transporter [Pseudonocardia sp. KRD-184]|uniref:MFS transporter n=1 Tax=Pseudonocardia oceani TaxID=2792013 RepID=A0ABS6U7X9_9PSEU|nr:MFS transporter [Pseudonocardia oceani]MBW0091453.1 MFS transporter [Pseudonocardia oceani]MBW0099678.1 MFS transporter [Pseudonocardia oceani]MBW0112369.1 MFS transporter [Pseudonocardia oceani]MBW0125597.1 MFS transporter [Pseudonocardia oceani]MBW0128318.1 MFS transporter [Pseudonocardia oceani]